MILRDLLCYYLPSDISQLMAFLSADTGLILSQEFTMYDIIWILSQAHMSLSIMQYCRLCVYVLDCFMCSSSLALFKSRLVLLILDCAGSPGKEAVKQVCVAAVAKVRHSEEWGRLKMRDLMLNYNGILGTIL